MLGLGRRTQPGRGWLQRCSALKDSRLPLRHGRPRRRSTRIQRIPIHRVEQEHCREHRDWRTMQQAIDGDSEDEIAELPRRNGQKD